MTRGPALGIDIVDLEHPRSRGKAGDRRFVARVFTDAEAAAIASADDPDRCLWALWAAKEAAFKAATLQAGAPPVFRHRAFEVALDLGRGRGRVVYEGAVYDLTVEFGDGSVVALAAEQGWSRESTPGPRHRVATEGAVADEFGLENPSLDELRGRLHADEIPAVHSVRSALARLALRRDVARWLDFDEARLSVVCVGATGPRAGRVPPRLLEAGRACEGVSVSLSHDGRWLAWAVGSTRPGDTASAG